MSWEKGKIGEHCEITSSKRIFYSEYVNTGVPFYRSKEIIESSQGQPISEPLFIRLEKYNEIKEKFGVPEFGDMLLTSVGTIGIPYIVKQDDYFYFKDGNLTWFRNFDEALSSEYLYYWVRSAEGHGVLYNTTIGSSQKALTISALKKIEIPLPPRQIQEVIVQNLSTYDNLIKNNQKQIKLLEEAAQRLYKEWFVDLRFPGYEDVAVVDGVPEGWKKEKLVDVADVQYGYAFDGLLFNSEGHGMPIIRIRNIPNGTTNDFTTEEASEQYLVSNGEIIVGMDGEFHINSWSGDTAYLVQRTCKLTPKKEIMHGWLLQAIYEPIKFFEKTVVGATVAHLGKKHIDTIELLTGTDDLYIPFNDLFEKRQLLLNQNIVLSEARDRLLPKLMSGELEV